MATLIRRRAAAIISAFALALSSIVGVFGASAVSHAQPVTASWTGTSDTIVRTVSTGTPVYGETIRIDSEIRRTGGAWTVTHYTDYTPACFEYVPGSARWQASGGREQSEATAPSEFSRTATSAEVSFTWPGVTPTLRLSAEYRVLCNAGPLSSGGADYRWSTGGNSRAGSTTMGPTITVQRAPTSIDLQPPATTLVGQPTTLTATTDGAPDGTTVEFVDGDQVVATATVTANRASTTWTAPDARAYQLRARVVQTNTHATSISDTRTLTVNRTSSTVALGASSPAMTGQPVTLTATTTGVPDGEPIEFQVDGTVIGTATVSDGRAVYTGWTPSTEGDYLIQASYAGSARVSGSESSQTMVTVITPIQTTSTSLDIDPAPTPGQTTILTATVTDGNDGDTVEFRNNGNLIGTATVTGGVATYDWVVGAGLAAQPYSVVASYLGSDGYAPSESEPATGTVGLVQTTVSTVSAPSTASVGESVRLSASVTGHRAGSTVEFRNAAGAVLCSVTMGSGTTAACNWTPTATGSVSVSAHYLGSSTTAPSASTSAATVAVGVSETSLVLTAPAATDVGALVALSVATEGIADGETIQFFVDEVNVGTATVSGGAANIQWTPTTAGNYTAVARYAGSPTVGASESNSATITVETTETTTSNVIASANPTAGQPVTLSATVAGGAAGVAVDFRDTAGTTLCTGTLFATGEAACDWTPAAVGPVEVIAHYAGDVATAPSQSPTATTVTVGQGEVASPTDLVVSPTAPRADTPLTVSGSAPVGSTVRVSGPGGSSCTDEVGSGGTFSCELGALPAGEHTLSAVATLNGVSSAAATVAISVTAVPTAPGAPTDVVVEPSTVDDGDSVTVSGTTEPGATITVTVGGAQVCTTTAAAATGTFSCTFDADASMDGGAVEVRATNAVGTSAPAGGGVLTVVPAPSTPAAPTGVSVSPQAVTVGDVVTVSGVAEPGADVAVRVGDEPACTAVADVQSGAFSCDFEAVAEMDGAEVTVLARNDAGVSIPASGGALNVSAEPVDPTEPSVVVAPLSPIVGQPSTITVTGDAGDAVVVRIGDVEVCRTTVRENGTATCTWTPTEAGADTIRVDVEQGGETTTIERAVTVRPADGPPAGEGSLPGGSLAGSLSGGTGSLGS